MLTKNNAGAAEHKQFKINITSLQRFSNNLLWFGPFKQQRIVHNKYVIVLNMPMINSSIVSLLNA